ncbi:trimeric intracellular cation channel family protein [Paracoccus sp. (in: a-proteobacteria)]|uniref:trimeric intracellular cation channel family protein n=1 Tax=Paracoccus sp. TaxID=267 RepID=UPI0028982F25|nr:trimeric intracellular cation channel family protein [Paracoccus sp. (in: a-proteobacteria)]
MILADAQLLLDYGSVFIFALTGALVASRGQLDLVGFIFFAVVTAVGGGTVRDLLFGRDAIFWVARPNLILAAVVAAVLVFFTAHLLESRYRALLWFDALALAVAVPAGVDFAMTAGFGAVIVTMAGVITASVGGLIRDVISNEVPLLLKQGELYLTAAFGGALAALLAQQFGLAHGLGLLACGLVTFALRAGSMVWGWKLPVYKPSPPKVIPGVDPKEP